MPLESPYSAEEIAASQAALRAALLQEAQKEAVGGPLWDVTRHSGNGVTEATTESDEGTIEAAIYRVTLSALEQALAGAGAPDAFWRLIVVDAQEVALQIGDELASQADATLSFTIKTLDQKYGALVGELEPSR
jgi:hypothetical protein